MSFEHGRRGMGVLGIMGEAGGMGGGEAGLFGGNVPRISGRVR